MIEHPKVHQTADLMAMIGVVSVGMSTVDQLEQGLRIIAIVLSIAAASVALYQRLRKPKKHRNKDLFDPSRLSSGEGDSGE